MTAYLVLLASIAGAVLGLKRPFVWVLAYLWLDYLRPQQVVPSVFGDTHLLTAFGMLGVVGAFLSREPVWRGTGKFAALMLLYLTWIALTTSWAVVPELARIKLSAAAPPILFSTCLLFAIRSIDDLAAVLWAILLGASVHVLTAGIKSLITGGGYAYQLGITNDNFGLAESSTLALMAVAFIPVMLFLRKIGWVPGGDRIGGLFTGCVIVLLAAACIGSHARSGLISFAALFLTALVFSRQRIAVLIGGLALAAGLVLLVAQEEWFDRMSSIASYSSDSSSVGRLEVWKWTLDYVLSNPLGGGFSVNETSVVQFPPSETHPEGLIKQGIGFHSLYFEVLGEHGWPGLILYLTLAAKCVAGLLKIIATASSSETLRLREMAMLLLGFWAAFLAGAAFVSIAHMPYFFNFAAVTAAYIGLANGRLMIRRRGVA